MKIFISIKTKSSTKNVSSVQGGGGGRVEERHMTDVDEEELEEEQDPHVRTTYSERILY